MQEKQFRIYLEKDIKPSDIMTRKAFENAITVMMVLGGSHQCSIAFDCYGKKC